VVIDPAVTARRVDGARGDQRLTAHLAGGLVVAHGAMFDGRRCAQSAA
jgi:hypothetical protein